MEIGIEMENINPPIIYSLPPPPNPDIDAESNSNPDAERNSNLRRLYRAARNGDWEAAKLIFERDELAKTAEIDPMGLTALHVAAICDQLEFVEKLVSHLSSEELQIQSHNGDTALHYAAMGASVEAAKAMVDKNPSLLQFMNADHYTPCHVAAAFPSWNENMLKYLYRKTDKKLLYNGPTSLFLIMAIIDLGFFGKMFVGIILLAVLYHSG